MWGRTAARLAALNGDAKYNGNISATVWKCASDNNLYGYGYRYDHINQLTDAKFARYSSSWTADVDKYSVSNLDYDLNGNIQTIDRRGPDDPSGYIDQLSYAYVGNKLISVEDAVQNSYDYDFNNGHVYSGVDEYAYDANGNMIRDDNKGILNVEYDALNLPTMIDFGNGNRIEWVYSAAGEKMRKTVTWSSGITTVTDYVGGFVYTDGGLDFFHTSEGRVENDNGALKYQYAIKDHLGNVRVSFDENGEIKQERHYYPFGLELANLGQTSGSDNKFRYNGKELQDEHNLYWYHYGARFYDPQLGRWHSTDPADEFWSPYCYGPNNPLNGIDPDGNDWFDFGDENGMDIQWRDGSDPQLKPGLWNQIKNLVGKGEYATSLGADVLTIQGLRVNEPINAALYAVYSHTNTDGPVSLMRGNSIPANVNESRTLGEGLYTDTQSIINYHDSHTNAIWIRGEVRATNGESMNGVLAHRGNLYFRGRYDSGRSHPPDFVPRPYSTGCPTFGYGKDLQWNATKFSSHFTNGMNVYLRRY